MARNRFPVDKLPQVLKNPPHDKEIMLYDKKKKERDESMNKSNEEKMTLAKLAKEMRDGFKQVNARLDNVEKRLDYNNLKRLPN